jgi:hypothetical protein
MNVAIYSKDNVNVDQIKKIKEHFLKEDYTANVFVANENVIQNSSLDDIGAINASNIHWFDGTIIFTSIEDYLNNSSDIIGQPIIILNDKTLLLKLDKDIVDKCKLLLMTNTKIRKVKNAELQSVIR